MGVRGRRWACADDLAMAMRNLMVMKDLIPVFAEAEAAVGLQLSATKMLVVLLLAAVSGRAEPSVVYARSGRDGRDSR